MTRINLIPVEELSDQHLIAEYKELPRCIIQDINILDAPRIYTLGKGHMKWARRNWYFLLNRFSLICSEMDYRGFKRKYSAKDLYDYFYSHYKFEKIVYIPSSVDLKISRDRIKEKLFLKPAFYKWTNRNKPDYIIKS